MYDTLLDMGSRVNSYLIEAVLDNKCKAIYGVEINTDNVVIGNPCVYTKPTGCCNRFHVTKQLLRLGMVESMTGT